MEWGFRIATDPRFGGGHIARCAALAAALGKTSTLFHDPGSRHDLWAGALVKEDAIGSTARAIEWLGGQPGRALIFDSYLMDTDDVAQASDRGFVAAFRDDGDCGAEHVSIDTNPGASERPEMLSGPQYFPLPSRFRDLRETAMACRPSPSEQLRILVAFGQRDSSNVTNTVMNALRGLDVSFSATVVLGGAYADAAAVRAKAEQDDRFAVRSSVADLAPLYAEFDLAIGAPGVSQFERACCGLPSVLVPQNDRQAPLAAAWADTGAAIAVQHESSAAGRAIAELALDRSCREAMRGRALETVDARGAERLASALDERAKLL